jgi:hypothetical protein
LLVFSPTRQSYIALVGVFTNKTIIFSPQCHLPIMLLEIF